MKTGQLGWVISAGLIGLIVTVGFQTNSDKVGFVDFKRAFDASKLKTTQEAALQVAADGRSAALKFANLNSTFTQDQLQQFEALVSKEPLAAADQAKLTQIEADVTASAKQFTTLSTKVNPTPADSATLNDLGNRYSLGQKAVPQLQSEFEQQIVNMHQVQQQDAEQKIRDAASEVAKKENYTIVFNDQGAVFGANDLTDETVKALDKKS